MVSNRFLWTFLQIIDTGFSNVAEEKDIVAKPKFGRILPKAAEKWTKKSSRKCDIF
jgi:hypothetical protein